MPPRVKKASSDNTPEENPTVEVDPIHPVDENPEEHMGDVMPDPWDDPQQEDWPTNSDYTPVSTKESN